MKIGIVSDSLAAFSLEDLLISVSRLGVQMIEFPTGNWSRAPHLNLDLLLSNEQTLNRFKARICEYGLTISALNCSGNPLAPGEHGSSHDAVIRKTIQLASKLNIKRIVTMSGLPAAPGDAHPNWITVSWPPETANILAYQWEEVAIPYWHDLAKFAADFGVEQICLEPHGQQLVYNVPTLLRLRSEIGDIIGANLDPSHLMWMGADPIAAVQQLGSAIYHVHAKDTLVDASVSAVNSRLETNPNESPANERGIL